MKKVSLILSAAVITAMMLSSCGGSSYKEVKIGNQVWMAENLNVEKFRNGDPIPHANTLAKWRKAGQEGKPAWCYYDNDPANGKIYGKLYNWYAVSDWRGLAPEGWRIPSDADWSKLVELLGDREVAGGKLKSTDTTYWKSPNTAATNETGFTALPGGFGGGNDAFDYIGNYGYWWSATESRAGYPRIWGVHYDSGFVDSENGGKEGGLSVRCIKD